MLQAIPCVPKSWNRRYGSRSGSTGNPVSLLICWTRTHQRQRDIDVDVGQTPWLSPLAAPLVINDGGPSSEHEPERVGYFLIHIRPSRSLLHLHQGTSLYCAVGYGFLGADQRPRVAGGL